MRSKWLLWLLCSFSLTLWGCTTVPLTPNQQTIQNLQAENSKLKEDLKAAEADLTECMNLVKEAIPEVEH